MARLHDDIADAVGVAVAAQTLGDLVGAARQHTGVAQQLLIGQAGQRPAGDGQIGRAGVVQRHRGDGDVELQLVEPFTGGVPDEPDALGQRVVVGLGGPVTPGQADDVGLARGDAQHPVTVAGDHDRHVGQVFGHVLAGVAQVVDPFTRAGIPQAGSVEFLFDVPRTEPQLEAALGQFVQLADIAGQQGRPVERRVDDECPDP